jgi:hypothetical protein
MNIRKWFKEFFTVPLEGERKEIAKGNFRIDVGSPYSYIRYDNGYSETIEIFDSEKEYLGSFESLTDAILHCHSVYGSPVVSTVREKVAVPQTVAVARAGA